MADNTTTSTTSTTTEESNSQSQQKVKFCPICGAQMYQGMRYGFLCWICPECDFDEPI
ncbi:hypothetical protein SAMN05192562_101275 [Kosakonia arachidis]|uniref:Uncharacterized protein n=1 Tax=Kosakonia arachidis TaxID=551989 RepID=A0A1I6Y0L1_9ENTR|nr:hypothetical protein SAMN05192562_101275 [Kosakonia arachidis]